MRQIRNGLAGRKVIYTVASWFTLLLLLSTTTAVYAQECKGPIDKDSFVKTLKKFRGDKDQIEIVERIKKCGVDFRLEAADIRKLCEAGVRTFCVIEALHEHYVPAKASSVTATDNPAPPQDNSVPPKLCEPIRRIIIAVVPTNSFGDAIKVRDALKKIECKVRDPKHPKNPELEIDPEGPAAALKYFDRGEADIAKRLADYIKRETNVTLEPLFVTGYAQEKGTLEVWIMREAKKD